MYRIAGVWSLDVDKWSHPALCCCNEDLVANAIGSLPANQSTGFISIWKQCYSFISHVCQAFSSLSLASILIFPGFCIPFMLPSRISVMRGYIQRIHAHTPPHDGRCLTTPLTLPSSYSLVPKHKGFEKSEMGPSLGVMDQQKVLQLTLAHEPPSCGDGGRRRQWLAAQEKQHRE